MNKLPVTQVLPEIKKQLKQHNRLILQAPPGAGKTTLVPLALLDQPWLANKQIIMLEPRRLATRNAAAYMAHLLGEKVGETVGYQIRQDKCYSKKTRILVVTEGILTQKLQADPELEGIALVIFDEFHERNINADISLAFCLQSQELLNQGLKILVMSATLNTKALAALLATPEKTTPIISSLGRSFPIEVIFQADKAVAINRWNLIPLVSKICIKAINQHRGNILVFLPGVREIKQLEQELLSSYSQQQSNISICPLYGDLSKQQQDQAISPPPQGQRKIVLATNIAETSLTIDGISVVIDSGLQRESHFNPGSAMNVLHTIMITQDSAEQRSGRAGRLSAGTCYRLWNKSQHNRLAAHQSAEILRSDLASLVLELAKWGVQDVSELNWLDLPPPGAISQAKDLLFSLKALDQSGLITPHGKKILSLGIHPRLAHMLITAQQLNLSQTSCLLAAMLIEKDILFDKQNADIGYRVSILQQVKQKQRIDSQKIDKKQCLRVLQTTKEFFQRLSRINNNNSKNKTAIKKSTENSFDQNMVGVLLAFAYPDRIAKLRNNKEQRYLLSNNKGAYFSHQDLLSSQTFLVIPSLNEQAKKQSREARIFLASEISQQQIESYFADQIKQQDSILWNKNLQKVDCLSRKKLGSIILTEKNNSSIESSRLHPTLLLAIKKLGLSCLRWSKEAIKLKQRIQFIHYQQENNLSCAKILAQIDLPDLSENYLLDNLEQWLLPHLTIEKSIKQLQSLDLLQILKASISWDILQQLDTLAPEKIKVPSGSFIAIDYSEPATPILAVRLQELFGLQATPAVLRNNCPLLLHLLSPASRPMQVTHDLSSFWENTYTEVKKELRGKYKKHYWPDDPLQAQATHRAKPRKH
ncbi:MAG: ATP-dependent helicase HrpB [Pseudomonadota bacterium]